MALISAAQSYYVYGQMPGGGPPSWRVAFAATSYSLLWALATPLVFWFGKRFPVAKTATAYNLPLHLLVSLALGFVHRATWLMLQFSLPRVTMTQKLSWEFAFSDLVTNIDYQAMVYWVLLAIQQGTLYYRKYQEGSLVASRLETQLAQAQLAGLKMQLQPHFLFNTLHSINALMYQNVEQASEMLVKLSDFLRASLEGSNAALVTLSAEVDFIQQYLDIERIRFEDRLEVDYDIEPSAWTCLVPNMILQPLVENAIKHGISRLPSGGRIEIRAKVRNENLEIFVANNGPLLTSNKESAATASGQETAPGIGVANVQARLQTLYGDQQSFLLRNWQKQGVEAFLQIPAQRSSGPPEPLEN